MEVCCWREYRCYPASLCCYKMRPCLYRRLPPALFHEVVGKHSQTIREWLPYLHLEFARIFFGLAVAAHKSFVFFRAATVSLFPHWQVVCPMMGNGESSVNGVAVTSVNTVVIGMPFLTRAPLFFDQ